MCRRGIQKSVLIMAADEKENQFTEDLIQLSRYTKSRTNHRLLNRKIQE